MPSGSGARGRVRAHMPSGGTETQPEPNPLRPTRSRCLGDPLGLPLTESVFASRQRQAGSGAVRHAPRRPRIPRRPTLAGRLSTPRHHNARSAAGRPAFGRVGPGYRRVTEGIERMIAKPFGLPPTRGAQVDASLRRAPRPAPTWPGPAPMLQRRRCAQRRRLARPTSPPLLGGCASRRASRATHAGERGAADATAVSLRLASAPPPSAACRGETSDSNEHTFIAVPSLAACPTHASLGCLRSPVANHLPFCNLEAVLANTVENTEFQRGPTSRHRGERVQVQTREKCHACLRHRNSGHAITPSSSPRSGPLRSE